MRMEEVFRVERTLGQDEKSLTTDPWTGGCMEALVSLCATVRGSVWRHIKGLFSPLNSDSWGEYLADETGHKYISVDFILNPTEKTLNASVSN